MTEFFPSGDSVHMVITLQPMHSDDFTRMSSRGWKSQLAKLDKRFREQQP
jgi:transposase-like protein